MARIGKLSALISLLIALVIPTWAQRPIGPGVITPGTATGLASAPSTQPGSSVTLSGGSIADGTYYCKTTNWNQNGETTGSPTRTITVTGGGGAAKIYIGNADFFYLTGAPGFRTYCSNDNVTFYRQTPNPVVADFMIDSFTHYNAMGSNGARLTSLTFSGTTIPITNAATITPLQVALNATRRAPTGVSAPVAMGTLFVPAIDGTVNPSGQFNLTTPLIAMKNDDIRGAGSTAGNVNMQTRIFDNNTWNNTKLAVVMVFGADAHISNLGIHSVSAGAALMILGGVGYQGGTTGPMTVNDVSLRNSLITANTACYKGVGILYDVHFKDVSFLGGFSNIEYRNVSGGGHSFERGRWDASGDSFIRNVDSWTDPDNGVGDAGFPLEGLGRVFVKGIRTEAGSGILWDVPNIQLILDDLEVADAGIRAGTDSIIRSGTLANGSGSFVVINNATPGSSANARVGIMNAGTGNLNVTLQGRGVPPYGTSTGALVGIDANNLSLTLRLLNATTFTANPSASGNQAVIMLNVPSNSLIVGGGGGSGLLTQGGQWFEIPDRLVFTPHTGNNAWNRAQRLSIRNAGQSFTLYGENDTTAFLTIPTGTGFTEANKTATYQWGLRVGESSVNPYFVVGAAAVTPAQSTFNGIGLANQYRLVWRNAANTANILGWSVNASDEMQSEAPLGIMPLANATPFGKAGKTWNVVGKLNTFDTATAGTASTIAARDASGRLTSKRFIADGTALVAGDFALSGGWGGGTVGTVTGTDQAWRITVTAAGAPGLNPTVTLTFKDGTWTTSPICSTKSNGGTGAVLDYTDAETATTNVITALGTPVAGLTYIITSSCGARP